MTVRIATRYDLNTLITMMKNYSEHSPIKVLKEKQNEDYVRKLFTQLILGNGRIFISQTEDKIPTGMLICVINPNVWNPDIMILQELAYWVEKEHRNGLHAYRLLYEYNKYGKQLMKENKISAYTISNLSDSNFDPSKHKFQLLESTYIKQ